MEYVGALFEEARIRLETLEGIEQLRGVLYHHQLSFLTLGLELVQLIDCLRPGCGEEKRSPRLLPIVNVKVAGLAAFRQAANRMASAVEDFEVAGLWDVVPLGFNG